MAEPLLTVRDCKSLQSRTGLIMITSFYANQTHGCALGPINALSGIKGPTGMYS